jgi:hypothetical protein
MDAQETDDTSTRKEQALAPETEVINNFEGNKLGRTTTKHPTPEVFLIIIYLQIKLRRYQDKKEFPTRICTKISYKTKATYPIQLKNFGSGFVPKVGSKTSC